jgi:hypothetical protein
VYATVNSTGTVVNTASITGTGTTLVVQQPTGSPQNDVMLAVQSGNAADLDDDPAARRVAAAVRLRRRAASLHVKVWTLTAGASEPSTYTFTQGTGSAGGRPSSPCAAWSRPAPPGTSPTTAGTGTTRTAPSREKGCARVVLLCGAMTDPGAARTWTPPTGMTEQVDLQSGTATTQAVASLLDPGEPTGTRLHPVRRDRPRPAGFSGRWRSRCRRPAPRRGQQIHVHRREDSLHGRSTRPATAGVEVRGYRRGTLTTDSWDQYVIPVKDRIVRSPAGPPRSSPPAGPRPPRSCSRCTTPPAPR